MLKHVEFAFYVSNFSWELENAIENFRKNSKNAKSLLLASMQYILCKKNTGDQKFKIFYHCLITLGFSYFINIFKFVHTKFIKFWHMS